MTPSLRVCVSMSSLSSGTHKPKDPPWLALVQSEHKKKKAPAPPAAGQATVPNTGSLEDSRPSTPPSPANPFDEDEDEGEGSNAVEEERSEGPSAPATVVAGHPWYSITQAVEATGADTPPSTGSSSRSASPGGAKSKKRPAPRAPQPPAGTQKHPNHRHYQCHPHYARPALCNYCRLLVRDIVAVLLRFCCSPTLLES